MNEASRHIIREYLSRQPVNKAFLFGSVARGQDASGSDIDILVELDYKNGAGYFTFFTMQQELSRLLNKKVDLVSANGLSSYIKPVIDKEKILIYDRQAR